MRAGKSTNKRPLAAVLELQQGDAMTIVNSEAGDSSRGYNYYVTHFEGRLINRMRSPARAEPPFISPSPKRHDPHAAGGNLLSKLTLNLSKKRTRCRKHVCALALPRSAN